MAALNKFHQFVEDLAKKVHNLDVDPLKILLTSTAPVATNSVRADLVEIAAGNGYVAGGYALAGVDAEQVSGALTVTASDLTITAAGGPIGPFRYPVLYNDAPAGDPLIGFYDCGAPITLADGESLTIDFVTSVFTLS